VAQDAGAEPAVEETAGAEPVLARAAGGTARARVGYLGPEGTFTEEALLSSALPDAVEPVSMPTIYDAILALRREELDWAVAPIENSLDGSISVTLDLLAGAGGHSPSAHIPVPAGAGRHLPSAHIPVPAGAGRHLPSAHIPVPASEEGGIEIVGEALLGVRHSLIAAEQTPLREIETVLTHPQVPGQCERFLRGELAKARVLAASSTAEAVRTVVAGRRHGEAALGTALAADIYGGYVIREGVQDRDDNETRFVWLARASASGPWIEPPLRYGAAGEGPEPEWKTSLVFWGAGADSPGWLVRCLDEFGARSINLTRIESRPKRERMGSYMFFVDLQGRAGEERVDEAVRGLRSLCEQVRVLGSYRRALPPSRSDPPSGGPGEGGSVNAQSGQSGTIAGKSGDGKRHHGASPSLHSGSADG
jgi:prephenate dehydratase